MGMVSGDGGQRREGQADLIVVVRCTYDLVISIMCVK